MPAEPHEDWIADAAFFDEGWVDMERRLDRRKRRRAGWWWLGVILPLAVLGVWLLWPGKSQPSVPPPADKQVVAATPEPVLEIPKSVLPTAPRERELSATVVPTRVREPRPTYRPSEPFVPTPARTTPPVFPTPVLKSQSATTLPSSNSVSVVRLLPTHSLRPLAKTFDFVPPSPVSSSPDSIEFSVVRRGAVEVLALGGLEFGGFRAGGAGGLGYSRPLGVRGQLFADLTYRVENFEMRSYLLVPPDPVPVPNPQIQARAAADVVDQLAEASADNLRANSVRLNVGYRRAFGRHWEVDLSAGADYLVDLRLVNFFVSGDRLMVVNPNTSFFSENFADPGLASVDMLENALLQPEFSVNRLRLALTTRVGYRIGGRFAAFAETTYLPQPIFEDNNPSVSPVRGNVGLRFRLR